MALSVAITYRHQIGVYSDPGLSGCDRIEPIGIEIPEELAMDFEDWCAGNYVSMAQVIRGWCSNINAIAPTISPRRQLS